MNAGTVELLIFSAATRSSPRRPISSSPRARPGATRVHMGLYHDETAELCHWHVPEAHYLESWGDARRFDGTVTLVQPLIAPLYDGRTAIEVLAALNGTPGQTPMELVKDYWSRAFGRRRAGRTATRSGVRHDGRILARRAPRRFPPGTSLLRWRCADARRRRQPRAAGTRPPTPGLKSCSGRIRTSSTAGSPTTAGCRSCRSRSRR